MGETHKIVEVKFEVIITPDPEMGETVENVSDLFEEALRDSGIVDWRVVKTLKTEPIDG